jgi:hypothetical protein
MENNDFELLKQKEIINILIGDTKYGENGEISMPYLSGSILCEISTIFGFVVDYFETRHSRWLYLYNLLECCIKNEKVSDLLLYIFDKKQFKEKFKGMSSTEIEENYKLIVEEIMEKINGCLYFSGKKLIKIENNFFIQARNKTVSIPKEKIKIVDSEYIKNIHSQALKCISENDFDSVVTKSRTLLEEVYCYGIEQKGEEITEKGNINKLYRKIRELYDMNTEKNLDNRIKKLLSGLNSIVDAIAEIRNNNSDAHGVGKNRIKISEHHANLVLNSATTLAEFILSVIENKNNN